MKKLNKKIFITGATHGIGKATAELFCANGWTVFGISSNLKDTRGADMMHQLPNFYHETIDVNNEEKIANFLENIAPLDAAFNNAGIGIAPQKIYQADISQAQKVINTNLLGTLICMKHELRHMPQGVIVNNASLAAFKAGTGADVSYAAAKAGILRLTAEAAIAPEYQEKISFFSLAPGYIETRMTAADDKPNLARRLPSGKFGQPQNVAKLVYHIIVHHYVFNSGQCFNYDEGASLI